MDVVDDKFGEQGRCERAVRVTLGPLKVAMEEAVMVTLDPVYPQRRWRKQLESHSILTTTSMEEAIRIALDPLDDVNGVSGTWF